MKLVFKLIFFSLFLQIYAFAQTAKKPVPVIFDTDMGPDYDDVGAIAMLHALADKGEATIWQRSPAQSTKVSARCLVF